MNNHNALERLSNIFSLLNTVPQDASISNLSMTLNVPEDVINNDICKLMHSHLFSELIIDDDDIDMSADLDVMSLDTTTPIGFDINTYELGKDIVPIYITHNEKQLLYEYYSELFNTKNNEPLYEIKETPGKETYTLDALCNGIQDAIYYNSAPKNNTIQHLEFIYYNNEIKADSTYTLIPRAIYHNTLNGRIYMLTYDNNTLTPWRLDQMNKNTIRKPKIVNKSATIEPLSPETLEIIDCIWGMDYTNGSKPVSVKVRIEPQTSNIIEKIKNDVARRKYGKLEKNADGYYYYTDKVIGLSSFRTWIHQYGSAMVVLEPESLAREIYDSALTRIKAYTS